MQSFYPNSASNKQQNQQLGEKQCKKVKIVAISDIHGQYQGAKNLFKQSGDIIIIAGDFTYYGIDADFDKFFWFLDSLKNFKHKIVIAGNHQIPLDQNLGPKRNQYQKQFHYKYNRNFIISELKKRAIYLEHQYIELEGLKIFASPYTIYYSGNAFQLKPQQLQVAWNQIPKNLDILITHGPPYKILDKTSKKDHVGCPILLQKVKEVRPKIHIFGHIHQGRPRFGEQDYVEVHETKFYNVAQRHSVIEFSKTI